MDSVESSLQDVDLAIKSGHSAVLTNGNSELKETLHGRAYQLEMLEESMKRNIIIAAETGSGKTLIAILRIQAELERCRADKFAWFCVPTVALAIQQHHAISAQLPVFPARVLSGADNVEFWTETWMWEQILKGIRIVVSTHQVLLDALIHGFVRMKQLALMVFDEAHSCIGNHPSSRILRDFYHGSPAEERPSILGLTASPVINNKVENLRVLESNLNAIAKTPKLHRAEMLQYVYKPNLIKLEYLPSGNELGVSSVLESLRAMYESLDLQQDPWIMKMQSDPRMSNSREYQKAITSHKTYCHDQIKGLHDKALAIKVELGPSAADYYISQCIQKFQRAASADSTFHLGFGNDEKAYLGKKFHEVKIPDQETELLTNRPIFTTKVHRLLEFLTKEEPHNFSGLIFVKTRAEVAVLSHLLSIHVPSFAISTFVGASGFSGRKTMIGELADVKNQKTTLDDLRQGRKNLIVSTNALEEGIDVAACNVVICFDEPPNLKSFIQRRGRARKSTSKFVLMFKHGAASGAVSNWHRLEEEMRAQYMDELRVLQEIKALEAEEEDGRREMCNESTNAKLTLDDAVQHLYHFCATLPAAPYVDLSPIFTFDEHSSGWGEEMISAKVVLPNSVDVSVREASSACQWKTEKMARRDAAFEAYAALYRKGLVSEHFLPLGHVDESVDEAYAAIEKRPSLVEASGQFNPWLLVAQSWEKSLKVVGFLVTITEGRNTIAEMMLLLPRAIQSIEDFQLHWDANTTFKVHIKPSDRIFSRTTMAPAAEITALLLQAVFRSRMDNRSNDFTTLFVPTHVSDSQESDLRGWLGLFSGTTSAKELCGSDGENVGLIRDVYGNPHLFRDVQYTVFEAVYELPDGSVNINHQGSVDITPSNHETSEICTLLEVTRVPKRAGFLHQFPKQHTRIARKSRTKYLFAEKCSMDRLPFKYSRFTMFIPSILHKIQVAMVADRLCDTVLSPLRFKDRELVITAISAPSAQEAADYNRLEFLGDSFLKFFTSLALMAKHPNFHEGILSHKKDHIVSNGPLALAAISKGLDQFILTKAFTGHKWRPMYNHELLQAQPQGKREMSSKTLADVVEALLGAAYLDGGPEKALKFLEIFCPDAPWSTISHAHSVLNGVYDVQIPSSNHLTQVERLILYDFRLKALLVESLTHPSHIGSNSSASYQRLEFLGDSVLDNIVTTTAFAHEPPIATQDLHLIRTALVNGNFLGYLCLTYSILLPRLEPVADDPKNISTIEVPYRFYLYQAMRHASLGVCTAQQACTSRLESLHADISEILASGTYYPWRLLARLEPQKFFSDIIESLIGAIYIDTHGSLPHCQSFLEHLGLLPYLRRAMHEDIALLHPKEELGRLADREKVEYMLGKEKQGEDGAERLTCTVKVGEREVARVGDGLSTMEVQTRAADEACHILRAEGKKLGPESGGGEDKAGDEELEAEEAEEKVRAEAGQEDVGGVVMDGIDLHEELDEPGELATDSDEYLTADE